MFPTRTALPPFWESVRGSDARVSVASVTSSGWDAAPARNGLTENQREALSRAVEIGYYDVPRQCTMVDLASEFGISDQAVSERLRRGTKRLIRNGLE